MASQRAQFHALFQYAQGPTHLWDSHTSALAEMEKTFQVMMRWTHFRVLTVHAERPSVPPVISRR